jgi:hypothetical protein
VHPRPATGGLPADGGRSSRKRAGPNCDTGETKTRRDGAVRAANSTAGSVDANARRQENPRDRAPGQS